jgi:hypothetical protein
MTQRISKESWRRFVVIECSGTDRLRNRPHSEQVGPATAFKFCWSGARVHRRRVPARIPLSLAIIILGCAAEGSVDVPKSASQEVPCPDEPFTVEWSVEQAVVRHQEAIRAPTHVIYRAGQLFVLDRAARDVFVVDGNNAARSLSAIFGPGFLSSGALGMAVIDSAHIVLWDHYLQRFVHLDISTGWSKSETTFGIPIAGLPSPIDAYDDGTVVLAIAGSAASAPSEYIVATRNGRPVYRIGPLLIASALTVRTTETVSTVSLQDDLSLRTRWAIARSGSFFVGRSDRYRISRLSGLTGDTIWTINGQPKNLKPRRDDIHNALSLARTTGIREKDIRTLLPKYKAEIVRIVASETWLFVQRPLPGPHTFINSYDVRQASDGAYCATVHLPIRVMHIADNEGVIAGIHYSDDGSPPVPALVSIVRRLRDEEGSHDGS